MSSYSFALPISTRTAVLTLVGLLSLTGVLGGAYNFTSPLDGAKVFGLVRSSHKLQTSDSTLAPFEKAYIRVHGIRNIGGSLTNLALLSYWSFSHTCKVDPVVADTVLRVLGLGLIVGTVIGLGDAWILKSYVEDLRKGHGAATEDREEIKNAVLVAKGKSMGHAITAVIMGAVGLGLAL